jgi:hypothetical protein
MQAFIEGCALIGQMLQRPRGRHWPTEMNATGGWQWLRQLVSATAARKAARSSGSIKSPRDI